jgi:FMN phosphatase YigB (HAD superfamily)
MNPDQVAIYERYGGLLLEAKMLAATDLPMLEAAARVRATLEGLYQDLRASPATIAALERLHKEQLIQLGLTPAARRSVPKLGTPGDGESRLKALLK